MSPTLTVIMPVYNAERYLDAALASLEQQTVRDFVVHIYDDGSTDRTADILESWLTSRLPGKVIGRDRIGIGNALAKLVKSAPTELIARMDGDDLCHPQRFAKQLAFMQRNPRVAVLGTQVQRIDGETGETISKTRYATDDAELRWQFRLCTPINHPTVVMRRAAVLEAGNYRDLRPGQDDDLWLRLSQRHRFANLPDCLLTYREHAASITRKQADAVHTFRNRRLTDCRCVFPGLVREDAQRLTHLLTHPDELAVTRRDVGLLELAAEYLAKEAGESLDTFKQTHAYREQLLNLRTRRFKSEPLLRSAWPIVKRGVQILRRPKRQRGTA